MIGAWDNEDDGFTFDETVGSWDLDGGQIIGGLLESQDGERLRVTSHSRIDNVTLKDMELLLMNGNNLRVTGDLTLDDAVVIFQKTLFSSFQRLLFDEGVHSGWPAPARCGSPEPAPTWKSATNSAATHPAPS